MKDPIHILYDQHSKSYSFLKIGDKYYNIDLIDI